MPGFFDPLPKTPGGRGWSEDQLRIWHRSQTMPISQVLGHDTHDHSTALGTAVVADLADVDAWQNYTPTTNLTLGNGTQVSRYAKIGTTIFVHFKFIFGASGSAVPTDPVVSLPVAASSTYTTLENSIGTVTLRDATGNRYVGALVISGTNFLIRYASVSGATIIHTAITATAPFTWANGDVLAFSATYEAA